mmetsp:Transcript_50387/g.130897  ORF Transcript_50387/g.130897 Transcript_50387/m.130897 type:complete len:244 (-) Transcript_50387:97-828(-)
MPGMYHQGQYWAFTSSVTAVPGATGISWGRCASSSMRSPRNCSSRISANRADKNQRPVWPLPCATTGRSPVRLLTIRGRVFSFASSRASTCHWGASSYMHWKTEQLTSSCSGKGLPASAWSSRNSWRCTWSFSSAASLPLPAWCTRACIRACITLAGPTSPPELGYRQGVLSSGYSASILPTKKWFGPQTRSEPHRRVPAGTAATFARSSSTPPRMTVSQASVSMTTSSGAMSAPTRACSARS